MNKNGKHSMILMTGAYGQVGADLVAVLRRQHGVHQVITTDVIRKSQVAASTVVTIFPNDKKIYAGNNVVRKNQYNKPSDLYCTDMKHYSEFYKKQS